MHIWYLSRNEKHNRLQSFPSMGTAMMLQKRTMRSQNIHLLPLIHSSSKPISPTFDYTPPIQFLLILTSHIPDRNHFPLCLPTIVIHILTQNPAVILASTSQQVDNSQILILQAISTALSFRLRNLQRWKKCSSCTAIVVVMETPGRKDFRGSFAFRGGEDIVDLRVQSRREGQR